MPSKPRPPVVRSVQTPEALAALEAWVHELNPEAVKLGREYLDTGRVERVAANADHFIEARVAGAEVYTTKLFLTRGRWTSHCTCPAQTNCKHAAAAALAWIAQPGPASPATPPPIPEEAEAAATARKISFREHWTPIIAAKLGRPLSESEGRQLGQLGALYQEFVQGAGALHPGALLRHGFEYTPPPGADLHALAFTGWWDPTSTPADPWALWQYIAYHYERTGRTIPPVFAPMTDTRRVRSAVHDSLLQQELAQWRRALGDVPAPANPLATIAGLRMRLAPKGAWLVEVRPGAAKPWRPPTRNWYEILQTARPSHFQHLPAADAALGAALAAESSRSLAGTSPKNPLPHEAVAAILRTNAARPALVLPDGHPFTIEPAPLVPEISPVPGAPDRLEMRLVTPDHLPAPGAVLIASEPESLYLFSGRVWRGPPPAPATHLPAAALSDATIMGRLRKAGLRLPSSLDDKVRHVRLQPRLKCWLTETKSSYAPVHFHAQLLAAADDPPVEQQWTGNDGWQWTKDGAPPVPAKGAPLLEFDLDDATAAIAPFMAFRATWQSWTGTWTRVATRSFPEDFLSWHASLPPNLPIEVGPGLTDLLAPPVHAHLEVSAEPSAGSGRDWFDLTVALRVEDTTLTPDEIALLLKARGKWVRLPSRGWRRLEVDQDGASSASSAALDRLGLQAEDVLDAGKPAVHRLHALQLASEAASFAAQDSRLLATLRERAAALTVAPVPPLPVSLRATLRPYQLEGFHFLTHLSLNGFGGVLADDMGLGKTVQALAWLLHLAEKTGARATPFRALVVCPKSVMHGWLTETARFAPALKAICFESSHTAQPEPPGPARGPALLVANYTQVRLQPDWFNAQSWDAVVLDEAQFIKNPGSQTAAIARTLPSAHRLALTGTPIENRLLDLWSIFAFAQPGLLGTQAAFRRQHPPEDPQATSRLHRRVRHFLLRRTKTQVAPELPPRIEDEIVVDLEGEQRKLYDAELKRARAQLLGIETDRALDAVRFNVLASLLRLRQICCHAALVDPAHAALPSAKLDALLERLEELRDEGQQVLVFSQFVSLLELIQARLAEANITHLMLTGQTSNRAELVERFQTDPTQTVFLLSLKAAGFGLNLTAASYVILCDPWWNPAVEAQAIDRTHRIGQTQPVVAYRLVAADTVEEKILALQKEKGALAAAVVQEESLAKVLDLESLRKILG